MSGLVGRTRDAYTRRVGSGGAALEVDLEHLLVLEARHRRARERVVVLDQLALEQQRRRLGDGGRRGDGLQRSATRFEIGEVTC